MKIVDRYLTPAGKFYASLIVIILCIVFGAVK
jgi:hypothetical protein